MKTTQLITTTRMLRTAFWSAHTQFRRRPGWHERHYSAPIRQAWREFVDKCIQEEAITQTLAKDVTL